MDYDTKKANVILRCIYRSIISKLWEVMIPVFSFGQIHSKFYISLFKKNAEKLKLVQMRRTKITRELEIKSCEDSLKKIWLALRERKYSAGVR